MNTPTQDSEALTSAQRQRITAHVLAGDRNTEPVFVGRDDLFTLVNNNVEAAQQSNAAGRTVCISGPPGIGKTAFLTEFKRRLETADRPIICVNAAPDQLRFPQSILRGLHNALLPHEGRFPQLAKSCGQFLRALGVSVSAAGVSVKLQQGTPQRELPAEDRAFPWTAAKAMLHGLAARQRQAPALVLMVDEAHQLKGTDGQIGTRNDVLGDLHMGGSLPVVPLLAGHVQTPDVLRASISDRYSTGNDVPMQVLSAKESTEYADWMLRCHYEAKGDARRVAQWIANECGGFPRHLCNAIQAVGEEMLRLNAVQLSALDGERISANLSKRRIEYYDGRLSMLLENVRPELAQVFAGLDASRSPPRRGDVLNAIWDVFEQAGPRRRQRLANIAPEDVQRELISKGVLSVVMDAQGNRRYTCIIESLRRYVETGKHSAQRPFPDLAAGIDP